MFERLKELNKLENYLREKNIQYFRIDQGTRFAPYDWHQIIVGGNFTPDNCDWDVVCHFGSYGFRQGLLKGRGAIFLADVEGWLTAMDVIRRIEAHHD